ncbi:C40 family peptidase [Streptomyces aidingensis]|uniref:NlpC/P60 family protein n=1 Tax=Streptomyces aidingensis TaxID=910347 RepID=A0A1I1KGA9_9ACTN|nr:C40 family peptidase [Streptomyces aidingensis]SFC59859.1 NlpC/P60 family protein [Streptomyces aidingensis]
MKTTGVIVGLAATGPLLLGAPLMMALAGKAAASSCTVPQAVDAAAVAGQVRAVLGGEGAEDVSVPGLDSPEEQVPLAVTVQATGVAMGVPVRGQVVALATALQESGLRNLSYGDRDSLGLFQQRPSQGWGSAEEILDPVYASTKFYEALRQVPGWESLTVTQAAQAVQASAWADAYAKWEPLATVLQQSIAAVLEVEGAAVPAAGCGELAGGDGTQFGPIPAGALPEGYKIPELAPEPVRIAIRWALGQLGTPYQWGGSCTDAHGPDPMQRCDCSSLMQMAYRAGGVELSRTTYTQVKEGRAVRLEELRPGDLGFTEGSAAVPEHVGMFIGSGLIVHAPRTGDVVRIATLADWEDDVLAIRRVV